MALLIIFIVSLVIFAAIIAAKYVGFDEKFPGYIAFRRQSDSVLNGLLYLAKKEYVMTEKGLVHFFKKGAPLFFAHASSLFAEYILHKSSKIVDMVKGRHVIEHGAGTVSPFLGQVAEYKDSDKI